LSDKNFFELYDAIQEADKFNKIQIIWKEKGKICNNDLQILLMKFIQSISEQEFKALTKMISKN